MTRTDLAILLGNVAGVDSGRNLPDDFGDCPSTPPKERIIDQITPHPLWVGHSGDGADARPLHDLGIEAVVRVAAVWRSSRVEPDAPTLFALPIPGLAGRSSSPLPLGVGPGVRGVAPEMTCGSGLDRRRSSDDAPHPGPLPEGEGGRRGRTCADRRRGGLSGREIPVGFEAFEIGRP